MDIHKVREVVYGDSREPVSSRKLSAGAGYGVQCAVHFRTQPGAVHRAADNLRCKTWPYFDVSSRQLHMYAESMEK